MLSLLAMAIWSSPDNPLPANMGWILFGAILLVVLMSVFAMRVARPAASKNPENWRAGMFYFNPGDPALFVPKRYGIGYTINFGNRWSWIVIGILAVLIIGPLAFAGFTVASINHSLNGH